MHFRRLLALAPASPRVACGCAEAHTALRQFAEAESILAQTVRRAPFDRALQEALANARWRCGQGDSFARDYEAAVAAFPDNVEMRVMCANLLCRADLHWRAEQLLRDGLIRDPNNLSYLLSLGVLLDESDRTEEGGALLERVAQRAPSAPSLAENLTNAYLRLARTADAMKLIAPHRLAYPHNAEWIAFETMALRQSGDPRYGELCDYNLMVRSYDIGPPQGFGDATAFNTELAVRLSALHAKSRHPLGQSLRGGSQTTHSLLQSHDPVIMAYLTALNEPIRAYMGLMQKPNHPWSGRKTGKFRLSGAWSIKLEAGGFHVNHIHPAGWISSAYYAALPNAVETATGQQGWIKFGEPRWPTPGCGIEKVVQPKVGRLVLFPSYMWHGTIPFDEGERLTAPFDVVPA